jgi:hypothetical protein
LNLASSIISISLRSQRHPIASVLKDSAENEPEKAAKTIDFEKDLNRCYGARASSRQPGMNHHVFI